MPGHLSNPNPRGDANPDELADLRVFLSKRRLSEGFVKNTVGIDRYDARLFSDVLGAEPELRALVGSTGEARGAPPTFGPLVLDLFASFYKMVPELVAESSVDPSHLRANRPFIERLREDEEALLARLSTATDEVASALATIEAARSILRELFRRPALADWMKRQAEPRPEDPTPPAPEPEPEGQPPRDPAPAPNTTDPDGPEGAADAPGGAPGDGAPGEHSPQQDPSSAQAAGGGADDVPEGFAGDLRALVRAASRAGAGEAGAHAAALRDWGLKPADLRTVPLGERLELARKLRTKRMRYLADLLGRTRNHRRASERRKVKANRDEIHGIQTSGDLSRALPSEVAGAFGSKNPHRKRDFYRRLSERSVLSYSLRTDEPVGRGPVIAMIDSSWSMTGIPMEWASAIALALAHAAAGGSGVKGGGFGGARRVHAIFFNAEVVLDVELVPGEKDVRKFLAVGTVDADGGTNYVPPLSRALGILGAQHRPQEGTPDLLLVTDGICKLPEDYIGRLREEKSARGFKLLTVLVGDHARAGSVEPFSDQVILASDLARASGARDAAGALFDSL